MSHHRSSSSETSPDSPSIAEPESEPIRSLEPPKSPPRHLQERVSKAIVTAAAEVLANRGAAANMADVAAAAGMARATVYRYFRTREALLEGVAEVAVSDAGTRLAEANLESVSPEEALARAVRAFFDVGDYFIVLARERVSVEPALRASLIEKPLRRLFARGQKVGVFRSDLPPEWLAGALVSVIEDVASKPPSVGRDDTVERVSSLFLDGIRLATPVR
jgi:TetR/AcrR family transcriptional repressor of mexCD-oprJ operon